MPSDTIRVAIEAPRLEVGKVYWNVKEDRPVKIVAASAHFSGMVVAVKGGRLVDHEFYTDWIYIGEYENQQVEEVRAMQCKPNNPSTGRPPEWRERKKS